MIFNEGQPLLFFACLGVGAASCVWYAILWVVRVMFKNKAVTAVCDVFFVTASVAAYFFCLLNTSGGEFRIFTLFAFFLGFAGFYIALRPLAKKIAPKIEGTKESLKNRKRKVKAKA